MEFVTEDACEIQKVIWEYYESLHLKNLGNKRNEQISKLTWPSKIKFRTHKQSNKIEAVIKSLCKEKPRARCIHYLILLNGQGSSKTSNCFVKYKGKEHYQIHYMMPELL